MDRTRIRSTVASLWAAADEQGDTDLAIVLARVHCALLRDQVRLLSAYMQGFSETTPTVINESARTRYSSVPALLERERG